MSKKAIMAILAFFALLTIIAVVGVEAQPSGNILTIVSKPSQSSFSGGYGTGIGFQSIQGPIVFSITRDGEDAGGGLNVNFYTVGISMDNGSVYLVSNSNLLNSTMQELHSYQSGSFLIIDYRVTDFYNVTFFYLSTGEHLATVYLGNSDTNGDFWVYIYASSSFVVDSQATPTPSPSPPPSPSPIITAISPSLTPTLSATPTPTLNPSPSPIHTPPENPNSHVSQTPSTSPTIPEFPLTALAITILTITVLVGVFFRKRKKGL